MKYDSMLRQLFKGIELSAEDLLQLESFQIQYLPDRVPQQEMAVLLRQYPIIERFLVSKHPPIKKFINQILIDNDEVTDRKLIHAHIDMLLWEIADLIVYNKYPEIYDEKAGFTWDVSDIIPVERLKNKVVADVGAGSGMLAFLLARYARTVYAIEPITSFRSFIRKKAEIQKYTHLYAVDGFLDSIPLPDKALDILFTSNAIGWNIEKELQEIERVVKPGGLAVHIMRVNEETLESPLHCKLVSSEANYEFYQFQDTGGYKLKYVKSIN